MALNHEQLNREIHQLYRQHHWLAIIRKLSPLCQPGGELWNDAAALSTYGFALTQQRRWADARRVYLRWIELEADKAQPYYCLGYVFYMQAQWREAIRWFRKALEIYPDYFVCLYRLGYALWSFQKAVQARKILERAVQVYESHEDEDWRKRNRKNYLKSRFLLGKVFLRLKRPEAAVTELEFVLQTDENHFIDKTFKFYELGKALAALGAYDRAIRVLEQAVHPHHPQHFVLDALGRIYYEQKDYSAALRALNQALRIRRKPFILIHRARTHLALGKPFPAIRDLNEALKRDRQGKHKILLELGVVHFYMEKYTEAVHYAHSAIRQKTSLYGRDYAEAHYLTALCYFKLGNKNAGREAMDRALALKPDLSRHRGLEKLLESSRTAFTEPEVTV